MEAVPRMIDGPEASASSGETRRVAVGSHTPRRGPDPDAHPDDPSCVVAPPEETEEEAERGRQAAAAGFTSSDIVSTAVAVVVGGLAAASACHPESGRQDEEGERERIARSPQFGWGESPVARDSQQEIASIENSCVAGLPDGEVFCEDEEFCEHAGRGTCQDPLGEAAIGEQVAATGEPEENVPVFHPEFHAAQMHDGPTLDEAWSSFEEGGDSGAEGFGIRMSNGLDDSVSTLVPRRLDARYGSSSSATSAGFLAGEVLTPEALAFGGFPLGAGKVSGLSQNDIRSGRGESTGVESNGTVSAGVPPDSARARALDRIFTESDVGASPEFAGERSVSGGVEACEVAAGRGAGDASEDQVCIREDQVGEVAEELGHAGQSSDGGIVAEEIVREEVIGAKAVEGSAAGAKKPALGGVRALMHNLVEGKKSGSERLAGVLGAGGNSGGASAGAAGLFLKKVVRAPEDGSKPKSLLAQKLQSKAKEVLFGVQMTNRVGAKKKDVCYDDKLDAPEMKFVVESSKCMKKQMEKVFKRYTRKGHVAPCLWHENASAPSAAFRAAHGASVKASTVSGAGSAAAGALTKGYLGSSLDAVAGSASATHAGSASAASAASSTKVPPIDALNAAAPSASSASSAGAATAAATAAAAAVSSVGFQLGIIHPHRHVRAGKAFEKGPFPASQILKSPRPVGAVYIAAAAEPPARKPRSKDMPREQGHGAFAARRAFGPGAGSSASGGLAGFGDFADPFADPHGLSSGDSPRVLGGDRLHKRKSLKLARKKSSGTARVVCWASSSSQKQPSKARGASAGRRYSSDNMAGVRKGFDKDAQPRPFVTGRSPTGTEGHSGLLDAALRVAESGGVAESSTSGARKKYNYAGLKFVELPRLDGAAAASCGPQKGSTAFVSSASCGPPGLPDKKRREGSPDTCMPASKMLLCGSSLDGDAASCATTAAGAASPLTASAGPSPVLCADDAAGIPLLRSGGDLVLAGFPVSGSGGGSGGAESRAPEMQASAAQGAEQQQQEQEANAAAHFAAENEVSDHASVDAAWDEVLRRTFGDKSAERLDEISRRLDEMPGSAAEALLQQMATQLELLNIAKRGSSVCSKSRSGRLQLGGGAAMLPPVVHALQRRAEAHAQQRNARRRKASPVQSSTGVCLTQSASAETFLTQSSPADAGSVCARVCLPPLAGAARNKSRTVSPGSKVAPVDPKIAQAMRKQAEEILWPRAARDAKMRSEKEDAREAVFRDMSLGNRSHCVRLVLDSTNATNAASGA